jgi:hypothetical protein
MRCEGKFSTALCFTVDIMAIIELPEEGLAWTRRMERAADTDVQTSTSQKKPRTNRLLIAFPTVPVHH